MLASDAAHSTSRLAVLAVIQKIWKPENLLSVLQLYFKQSKLVYATALALDLETHTKVHTHHTLGLQPYSHCALLLDCQGLSANSMDAHPLPAQILLSTQ